MKFKTTGKSLIELLEIYGQGKGGLYSSWWKSEPFAKEKSEAGLYEINTKKKLTDLDLEEQKKKLPKGWDFPHPAVLAEAILSHYKTTGERLFEDWWSTTSRKLLTGRVSCVGNFYEDGLHVNDWTGDRDAYVGVGASRKLKSKLEPGKLDALDGSNVASFQHRISALEADMEKIRKIINLK